METFQNSAAEIRFENCGTVIREAREEVGVSIRDLAEKVSCDRGQISKIETNKLALSMAMLEQFAEALELPPEKLVLRCLELRFPKLRSTRAGSLVLPFLSTED